MKSSASPLLQLFPCSPYIHYFNDPTDNKHIQRFWSTRSPGLVDLHFHGAFGIDLMTATHNELNVLSEKLWEHGVAAFCPTILSASPKNLKETIDRIGTWVRSMHGRSSSARALPLGIHLEGPFINPKSRGAHPAGVLRPLTFAELEELWRVSQHTLKILTLAPETLELPAKKLANWAETRKILLSLGHSQATQAQAHEAFRQGGFRSVTHAWNALSFHHRNPGSLGAALGNPKVFLELIPDLVHVDPTVIRWTRKLHGSGNICFVSDCVPAAHTSRHSWHPFGSLKIAFQDGACRLKDGTVAGGGLLLSEAYALWLRNESKQTLAPMARIFKESIGSVTEVPLRMLKIPSSRLRGRTIYWRIAKNWQKDS